jgi:ATP-dependent Clp protease protease subunit
MTAIQVHHTATDTESSWDGPGEVAKAPAEEKTLRYMHAWIEAGGDPNTKASFKFPHHKAGTDTAANIKGVNNGLARLSQANIPEADRPGVQKHLNAHRKDAGLGDSVEEQAQLRQPIRIVEGNAKPFEPFWRAQAATADQPAEIDFIGYISEFSWLGDEITPQLFKDDLARVGQGGPITIRMHSGGGDVFAASAIRAMLIDYPGPITVKILGLAASAAVAIALAGDEIQIFDTAYMMIHNPGYTGLMGWMNAELLRKFAEALDIFSEGLVNAYAARSGQEREAITQMMDAETWMTAQQAVELGFADRIITGEKAPAPLSASALQAFSHVPAALINSVDSGQAPGVVQTSPQMQAHRTRLEAAKNKQQGEIPMSAVLRKMLAQRAELVAQAQQIIDKAEAEERELAPEERAAYTELLGEGETAGAVGELDGKIATAIDDRKRLREAAGVKFTLPGAEAVKPDGGKPNVLKRAEFDHLNATEQTAFMRGGGKVED